MSQKKQIDTSVAALLFSDDRKDVLLIQRRDVPVWVLPGGGIDEGETPEEAVTREILEETGFHVNPDRLVGVYHPINRLTRLTYLFECKVTSGLAALSNETKGIRFYPVEKLPLMPPPYLEWIQDGVEQGPTKIKTLSSITYASVLKYLILHPILVFRFFCARFGIPINS
jgi:8-oxo-dGTP pyrophosphatase MutT (NUDIX family)